jgi:hypothetical protein
MDLVPIVERRIRNNVMSTWRDSSSIILHSKCPYTNWKPNDRLRGLVLNKEPRLFVHSYHVNVSSLVKTCSRNICPLMPPVLSSNPDGENGERGVVCWRRMVLVLLLWGDYGSLVRDVSGSSRGLRTSGCIWRLASHVLHVVTRLIAVVVVAVQMSIIRVKWR